MALVLQALPVLAVWMWTRRMTALSAGTRLAAALGIGLGMGSTLLFLWRLGGGSTATFAVVDPALWVVAILAALALASASTIADTDQPRRGTRHPWRVLLLILGLSLAGVAGAIVWTRSAGMPYGDWDAWAIWNLHARFLADPSLLWLNAFAPDLAWSHPDYPLLLPGAVARAWVFDPQAGATVPFSIAAALLLATMLVMVSTLHEHRGASGALLALSLLLAPQFVQIAASQCADLPLGFFTVLAVALLGATHPSAATLGLAGVAMGMAAWTKNEGLVVAVLLPCLYVWRVYRRVGFSAAHQTATDIVVGLYPMLVVLALFKIFVAPENDLVSGMLRPGVLNYWSDPVRVSFVAREMLTEGLAWGGWPVMGPVLLIPIVALVRTGPTQRVSDAATSAAALLVAQLAIFFVIYVMTPHSVAWHLQTSWHRLIAQMWPTAVWWACVRRSPALEGRGAACA
ncbi:MAG TPA: hypothetical protein PLH72_09380 [Vicinamibacterales bacterium]|nr:hypothetical protein [Vicinamibacterales bacterium]